MPAYDHFYTTSASERDNAIANLGYQDEGTACYLYGAPTGTVPLYRLVKEGHFYTTDLAERDNAITIDGFHSEGIACHVFDTAKAGTVPLYRLLGVGVMAGTQRDSTATGGVVGGHALAMTSHEIRG